jgi:hypothetical protein
MIHAGGSAVSGAFMGWDDVAPSTRAMDRVLSRAVPEFAVAPGMKGYFRALPIEGVQEHYYDAHTGTTIIAGDVASGAEVLYVPVAWYEGPPSTGVHEDSLKVLDLPVSALIVRLPGMERVRVTVTRQHPASRLQTKWTDRGEVRFALEPGTYGVAVDTGAHEVVRIGALEVVLCTLSPAGNEITRLGREAGR